MTMAQLKFAQHGFGPLQSKMPDGKTVGLFYLATDRQRHLAYYEPYRSPPGLPRCGQIGIPASTGSTQDLCPVCITRLAEEQSLPEAELRKALEG